MDNSTKRKFASISAEVRYFIKEALNDEMPHYTGDLQSYVKSRCSAPEKCSRGVFSGVFRDLILNSDGTYFTPERGVYQKRQQALAHQEEGEDSNQSEFTTQIVLALRTAATALEEGCKFNMLNVTNDDFKVVQHLRKLLKDMNGLAEDLDRE